MFLLVLYLNIRKNRIIKGKMSSMFILKLLLKDKQKQKREKKWRKKRETE